MAKETKAKEQSPETAVEEKKPKKSFFSKKLIIFGAVIFVVQFAVLYFLSAKLIIPMTAKQSGIAREEEKKEEKPPVEQQIFLVKDIIINPAGTNGSRFLLTTIGFEVNGPEAKIEIEKKEVELRDVLNTVLTSKPLEELAASERREALRDEIARRVTVILKPNSLAKVYFSKYIIQ